LQAHPLNEITSAILKCAFTVHTALGPGLLESSYEECLCYEMNESGLLIERQLALPLIYKAIKLNIGYRVDFRVEQKVIVEVKACESLNDIHVSQVLTYLKLSSCTIGLLINFNVLHLKQGIRRLIL
jgi:GxxExxY protein